VLDTVVVQQQQLLQNPFQRQFPQQQQHQQMPQQQQMQQWHCMQSNPGERSHDKRSLQHDQGQPSWQQQQQQQQQLQHLQQVPQQPVACDNPITASHLRQPGSSSTIAPAQQTMAVQLSQSARQPKRAALRSSKSQLAAQKRSRIQGAAEASVANRHLMCRDEPPESDSDGDAFV
jgi:hypothetical protein